MRVTLFSLSLLLAFLFLQKEKLVSAYLSDKFEREISIEKITWDMKRLRLQNFSLGNENPEHICSLSFIPKWSFKTINEISLDKVLLEAGSAKANARVDLKPKNHGRLLKVSAKVSRSDISDLMKCFDLSQDEITSQVEIPQLYFQMRFSENGVALQKSIKAHGDLILYQGKFKFLDIVSPVVNLLNPFNEPVSELKETKSFDKVTANFLVEKEKVLLEDIHFDSTYVSATGKGEIDFASNMDIELFAKGLEKYIPFDRILLDQVLPRGLVPIRVRGRLEDPKVRPSVTAIPKNLSPKLFDKVLDWFN